MSLFNLPPSTKKPLPEHAGWRGEVAVNPWLQHGMALEWEGKLWCGTEADRAEMLRLIEADKAKERR